MQRHDIPAGLCELQTASVRTNDITLSNGQGFLLGIASVGPTPGPVYAGTTLQHPDPPSGMRTTVRFWSVGSSRHAGGLPPPATKPLVGHALLIPKRRDCALSFSDHTLPLHIPVQRLALHCACVSQTRREEVCLKPATLVQIYTKKQRNSGKRQWTANSSANFRSHLVPMYTPNPNLYCTVVVTRHSCHTT